MLEFHRRHITPKVTGTSVKEKLQNAISYFDAAVINQAIMDLQKENESLSYQDIEKEIRSISDRVYLLALPATILPSNVKVYSFTKKQDMKYWLWIEVNGINEVERVSRKFVGEPFSYEVNFGRLNDTGVQVLSNT